MICTDPDDMRYKTLADRARYFKKTEEGVRSMCRLLEEMREETAKETAKETANEFAYKSVKEGKFTFDEAKSFFGLTDHEAESILRDFMFNDQTP